MEEGDHFLNLINLRGYVWFKSEIAQLLDTYQNRNEAIGLRSDSKKHPDIINNSRIILERGINVSCELYTLGIFHINPEKAKALREELSESWHKLESAVLFKSLAKCNKVALLLQTQIVDRFAKKLRNMGKKHVSIGKEALLRINAEFQIRRFLPSFVRSRIKSVEMSGLWTHWNNLVEVNSKANAWRMSPLYMSRPNMNGHLLAVFVVLMIGCLVAIGLFFIELIKAVICYAEVTDDRRK